MSIKTIFVDADIVAYRAAISAECLEDESFAHMEIVCYVDDLVQKIETALPSATSISFIVSAANRDLNFRKKLFPDYKSNRKEQPKPKWLDLALEILVANYAAVIAVGAEGDDLLGIHNTRVRGCCVASIDKDLMMVPGYHYNFDSGEIQRVVDPGSVEIINRSKAVGTGFAWFCCQLLMGDRVDGISGLTGIGPVKAVKALEGADSYRELWLRVLKMYRSKGACTPTLVKNVELLWIMRFRALTFWTHYATYVSKTGTLSPTYKKTLRGIYCEK